MKALARLFRPLRHLLPLAWRIEIKTWIRDRSQSHRLLSRMLRWFVAPVPRPVYRIESDLTVPTREEWKPNSPFSSPLLTVVLPYYNQGDYLMEALESVWGQTFTDFEVIVVNDGSTDQPSIDLLETIDEPRTRIIHRENGGLPAARNTGLQEARGKYLCCLDSDDAIHPTHFEKLLVALESRQCDLAHCDLERFDKGEGFWRGEGFHLSALIEGNTVGNTATGILRLEAWKTLKGYDENLRGYQDWDFWLRLAATGHRGTHIPEPLFLYRRHGTSMISRSVRRHRELTSQILAKQSEFTDAPEKVQTFEESWQRQVSSDPFLNLTPQRHRPLESLITVSALPHPAVMDLIQSPLDTEVGIAVKSNANLADSDFSRIERSGIRLYCADNLLPPEHADDLASHLIRAHTVEHVVAIGEPESLQGADISALPISAQGPELRQILSAHAPH